MKRQDVLVPPPRHVPLSTWITLHFGGTVLIWGWILFAFGMISVFLFGSGADFTEPIKFRGPLQTVQAEIVDAEETSLELYEQQVVHWFYRYEVDGQVFDGSCYKEGKGYAQGERVSVEFPPGSPELARIVGGRRGSLPAWLLLFVAVFPAVGGICVTSYGLYSGRKAYRLLHSGVLTRGTLKSKESTNMWVGDEPICKLIFTFSPQGSLHEYTCHAQTHATEVLEDEPEERLLYLPSDPFVCVMLDSLPGGVEISSGGKYLPANTRNAVLLSCAPTLALIFSLLFLLRALGVLL